GTYLATAGLGSPAVRASTVAPRSAPFQVVVAENFWGSIARQEAGTKAQVTSIIVNPNADPHAYEPTAADARLIASSRYFIMNGALRPYHHEISLIARKYHGVPVGATESIFQYLAQSLKLNLITPYSFMKALSEGTEPTAQDRVTFDQQITKKQIKVFVFNSQ